MKQSSRVSPSAPVRRSGLKSASRPAPGPEVVTDRFTLQRSIGNTATAALFASGAPLDSGSRDTLEHAWQESFGDVRVHSDATASESARQLGARAYTVGHHIVFGAGEYRPHAPDGRRLLGHEAAHVVQQRRGGMASSLSPGARARAEGEADRGAARIAAGAPAPTMTDGSAGLTASRPSGVTPIASGTVQCQRDPGMIREPAPQRELTVAEAIPLGASAIAGLSEAALREATMPQRVLMLEQLIQAGWTGLSEEAAIISILKTTGAPDAKSLLAELETRGGPGHTMIDQLDQVVDLGNNLLLRDALSLLRLRATDAAAAMAAMEDAPVLPWHNVMGFFETRAQFTVSRTARGRIRVKYPARLKLGPNDFSAEFAALPDDMFTSPGHAFEPDAVVWVHDYDRSQHVPLIAQDLVGYKHQLRRNLLADWAEIASLAMPLGPAKTVAGKAAVVIVEKVLPVTGRLVNENRLNIVRRMPEWGPRILFINDLIQAGVAIYGIVQFARNSVRLVQSWREARRFRALSAAEDVDPEIARPVREVETGLDDVTDGLDNIRVAEDAPADAINVQPPAAGGGGAPAAKAAPLPSTVGRTRSGTMPGLENAPVGESAPLDFAARARKLGQGPPPPPSEPNAQAIPVPQQQLQVGQGQIAVGAGSSRPGAPPQIMASAGTPNKPALSVVPAAPTPGAASTTAPVKATSAPAAGSSAPPKAGPVPPSPAGAVSGPLAAAGPVVVPFGQAERAALAQHWQAMMASATNAVDRARYQRYLAIVNAGHRPGWRQTELEMEFFYRSIGGQAEVPYYMGRQVGRGTAGSTRPDLVLSAMIEVKNYRITNKANLIAELRRQLGMRRGVPGAKGAAAPDIHGSANIRQQAVILDLRGQVASPADIQSLAQDVANGTQIPIENIQVLTW